MLIVFKLPEILCGCSAVALKLNMWAFYEPHRINRMYLFISVLFVLKSVHQEGYTQCMIQLAAASLILLSCLGAWQSKKMLAFTQNFV